MSDERTYTYTLFARDLAGNSSSAEGECACRPRRARSAAETPDDARAEA